MADRTPFEEDRDAGLLARRLGFVITRRYNAIDVYDERALAAAGFTVSKPKPDFAKIAEALHDGREVPGARFRSMEYVLRPTGADE